MPRSSGSRGRRSKSPRLCHTSCWVRPMTRNGVSSRARSGSKKYGATDSSKMRCWKAAGSRSRSPLSRSCAPLLLKRGIEIPPGERALELVARGPPRGRGRYEREPAHPAGVGHGVQQRQQPTPRVAGERQPLEPPRRAQRVEIGHLLGPAHRHVPRHRRAAAAALVVVDQLPARRRARRSRGAGSRGARPGPPCSTTAGGPWPTRRTKSSTPRTATIPSRAAPVASAIGGQRGPDRIGLDGHDVLDLARVAAGHRQHRREPAAGGRRRTIGGRGSSRPATVRPSRPNRSCT